MTSIAIDRLDGLSSASAIKGPCRVATTANITLSGTQTIDGVAVVAGDRVLAKNQTTGSENGVYVVDTGPWRRAKDFSLTRDVVTGTMVYIAAGTLNAGRAYQVSTTGEISVGTTSIALVQLGLGLGDITVAGRALLDDADADAQLVTLGGGAAGISILKTTVVADARNILDAPVYVATRTALKALDTTKDTSVILTEAGREGNFVWRSGNYSTQIAADTAEGVYVKANAIAATAGSWVRKAAATTSLWLAAWFGILGDDSTDNTTAITAAIAAFPAAGGILMFGNGTFRLTSVSINKPIVFVGVGEHGGTTFKSTVLTGNVITVTAFGAAVRDARFTATANRTSGAYIFTNGVAYCHYVRLYFEKYYYGMDFDGSVASSISHSEFRDGTPSATAAGSAGIRFTGAVSVDCRIDSVLMDAGSGVMPAFGILLRSTDALQIISCDIIHHGNDLQIEPGNGQSVAATYVVNTYFDTAANGIYIAPTGTGTVLRATFNGCWSASHSANGCYIGLGTVLAVQFVGCHMQFNGSRGLLNDNIAGDIKITGGFYSNNTSDGIAFGSGVGGFTVIGVNAKANGASGILLVGSNSDYIITDNVLTGNVTSLSGFTATTTTKIVRDNIGFVSENSGTTSITFAAGAASIAHGLGATPKSASAFLVTGGAGEITITSVGATNINIRGRDTTTNVNAAGTFDVMWNAAA